MAKATTTPRPATQMSLFPPEAAEPEEENPAETPAPTDRGSQQPGIPSAPKTGTREPGPALQLTPLLQEATESGRHRRDAAGREIAATLATLRELCQQHPQMAPRQLAQLAREQQPDTGLRGDLIKRLAALDTSAADPRLLEEQRYLLHQDLLDGRDGKVATEGQVADFLALTADPAPESRVLDLCCGSGRLLVHAWLHMLRRAQNSQTAVTGRIQGMEINLDLAEAAGNGMRLHDITGADIAQGNSLDPVACRRAGIGNGQWDLIIANLPLGVKVTGQLAARYAEEDGILSRSKKSKSRIEAEILLLQRTKELLATGGRAALVVSDGLLSNSSDRYARDWIMRHFALEGVISLPRKSGPITTAKTSVLLLRRMAPYEEQAGESLIFIAICKNDGHNGRQETSARYALDGSEDSERTVILHNDLVDYLTTETRLTDGSWLRTSRFPTVDPNHPNILYRLNEFYRHPTKWEPEHSAPTS